jgi:hypothetical protein
MLNEEWIKTLEDGRTVKFVYQELPKYGAFITSQLAGNEVVYLGSRCLVSLRLKIPLHLVDSVAMGGPEGTNTQAQSEQPQP